MAILKQLFLSSGESMYESMLIDLKNAKKYIFLEFFIINKGLMWDTILDILIEKVKEGVDVKLIYDDFGSSTLPFHYPKNLKNLELMSFHSIRCVFI